MVGSLPRVRSRSLLRLLLPLVLAGCGSPTLQAIDVTPAGPSLAKGASLQLVATAHLSDASASDVTGIATWASTAPEVAGVSSTGLASGVAVGSSEVTATLGQVTGRTTIAVGPAVAVGIDVTPPSASVALGLTAAFQASQYLLSDGTRTPLAGTVTWSSQSQAVATVDASGVAQSRGQGTTSIGAAQGSLSGSATLTVGPPVPVSVTVVPASVTVFPGRSQQFTATAAMTDGTSTDVTSTATWTSSDPSAVSVTGGLALSQGRAGATIQASLGAVAGSAALQVLQARIAFATSNHGTANLGAWSYGVGTTGVDAADAICQASARAGRLPGTYRAFISDVQDDAYCRMHGLHGTIASSCGSATLPATAGPWMRTDGAPYAARIDRMVEAETYNPLAFDEYGDPSGWWPAFTGSDSTGARQVGGGYYTDCSGWTSSVGTGPAAGGYESMTSFALGSAALGCDQNGALFCFEVGEGEGPPLPPRDATGKLAFMTSVRGPGMLSAWPDAGTATGIAAGDAICRARAAAAGFANATRFKAWLSDASTDAVERIAGDGPWVRPDGVLVAADKARLVGGYLASSISVTETGLYVNWVPGVSVASLAAWTGTSQQGRATSDHCLSWTAAAGASGAQGATNDTTNWSHLLGMPPPACTSNLALYCLED